MTHTLSTSISTGITLTAFGTDQSPFTITSTGTVAPTGSSEIGVYGSASSGLTLINQGVIKGGQGFGQYNHNFPAAGGGSGVVLSGVGLFSNSGVITGGLGGFGYGFGYEQNGGAGGTGVALSGAGTFSNSATITGGYGGAGHDGGTGGAGGTGVIISGAGSFTNSATIAGGSGGKSTDAAGGVGGAGGAGIVISGSASFTNNAIIAGGFGNVGEFGGAGGNGVDLAGSGSFNNRATINGGGGSGQSGNYGTGGAGGTGVDLSGSSSFNNSGAITGGTGGSGGGYNTNGGNGGAGIEISGTGSFDNSGTITGGYGGYGGGNGFGPGSGGVGAQLDSGVLLDSGRIAGAEGADAVQFGATASTLIVESGATFIGRVVANAAVSDILAIGGSAPVSLAGIGTKFQDFSTLTFDTGTAGTVSGTFTGFSGLNIAGFIKGDTLILDGFAATSDTYVSGIGLELRNGAATTTLDIVGPDTTASFIVSESAGSTTIAVHCYGRGTRIETPLGDIEIEALAVGDLVSTASGAARPIRWIGTRSFDPRFVGRNPKILPIRICADALADGVPRRDLLVSPEHAMLIDGVLVAAKYLVNGVSVRQEAPGANIEYFHIELDDHDAVLAEGAASETYVEDGDRGIFRNAAAYRAQQPARPVRYCAERVEQGARLAAIQARIDARAGVRAVITNEPGIHLLADGVMIRPVSEVDGVLDFDLPRAASDIVLVSRRTTGTGADRRGLGIAVAGVTIDGQPVDLARMPDRGWYHLEHEGARHWRWTDGTGQLPPTAQPCRLTITVAGTLHYRELVRAA